MSALSRPERHGKPWSDTETQTLLQSVKHKETMDQIANKHKRSVGGIRSRLRSLAADYYFHDSRPMEEIVKFTGLSVEEITDAISRRQWEMDHKDQTKKTKCLIVNDKIIVKQEKEQRSITDYLSIPKKDETVLSLLTEIRDLMNELIQIQKDK